MIKFPHIASPLYKEYICTKDFDFTKGVGHLFNVIETGGDKTENKIKNWLQGYVSATNYIPFPN